MKCPVEVKSRLRFVGDWGLLFNGYWVSLGVMEVFWNQTVVMATQHRECTR